LSRIPFPTFNVLTYEALLPEGTLAEFKTYAKSDEALKFVLAQTRKSGNHIYLMIDEYDNFANTLMAESEDDYCTITHGVGAFRLFFNILKLATTGMDSPIDRMFITGVSPLTLSDVTSGFNIGENFSLKANYNEMVGFTETEVRAMLEYYRDATGLFRHTVDELLSIMKPWYNNNCFSSSRVEGERMFNSDMALYFVKNYIDNGGHFPEDMIDTNVRSDYNRMRKMVKMDKSYGEKGQIMQYIFENRGITGKIKPEFSIEDLLVPENLTSHLFYMGLLTYELDSRNRTAFVIPNHVVYEQYYRYMEDCYRRYLNWQTDTTTMNRLREKLVYDGYATPLLDYLCHQITIDSSNRDFDPQAESFVKGFLLAKLGGCSNSYLTVDTEREENHGYSDLYMQPWNDDCKHTFLVELKYCKHGSPDTEVARQRQQAIDQAVKYAADQRLQQRAAGHGWTLHQHIIVFRGWHCEVCEEISADPSNE